MTTPKRNRTPLETVDRLNYTMLFAGKVRTFEKVIITLSPFDGKECLSIGENRRLAEILRQEVLFNDKAMLIGEVQVLWSLYRLKRGDLFDKGLVDTSEYKKWRYDWHEEVPLEQSLKIKEYLKSLPVPSPKMSVSQ